MSGFADRHKDSRYAAWLESCLIGELMFNEGSEDRTDKELYEEYQEEVRDGCA